MLDPWGRQSRSWIGGVGPCVVPTTERPLVAEPLGGLVEFEEERFQLGESVFSELRLPVSLDVLDGIADGVRGPLATVGEGDALRSAVDGDESARASPSLIATTPTRRRSTASREPSRSPSRAHRTTSGRARPCSSLVARSTPSPTPAMSTLPRSQSSLQASSAPTMSARSRPIEARGDARAQP